MNGGQQLGGEEEHRVLAVEAQVVVVRRVALRSMEQLERRLDVVDGQQSLAERVRHDTQPVAHEVENKLPFALVQVGRHRESDFCIERTHLELELSSKSGLIIAKKILLSTF